MTRRIPGPGKHASTMKLLPQSEKRDKHKSYPSFSFKYFQSDHPKFNVEEKETKYFLKLITRLADLSGVPVQEIRTSQNKTLRCHTIHWAETTETGLGIPDEEQIVDEPWQFSISANVHG
jgi:hypothetical protein